MFEARATLYFARAENEQMEDAGKENAVGYLESGQTKWDVRGSGRGPQLLAERAERSGEGQYKIILWMTDV